MPPGLQEEQASLSKVQVVIPALAALLLLPLVKRLALPGVT
jgi:hypothetical protein